MISSSHVLLKRIPRSEEHEELEYHCSSYRRKHLFPIQRSPGFVHETSRQDGNHKEHTAIKLVIAVVLVDNGTKSQKCRFAVKTVKVFVLEPVLPADPTLEDHPTGGRNHHAQGEGGKEDQDGKAHVRIGCRKCHENTAKGSGPKGQAEQAREAGKKKTDEQSERC